MRKIKTLAYCILKVIWKIAKPNTLGTRVLLIKENTILLVKHSYQSQWYLPGGGLKKGETYEDGLRRELKEELNAQLSDLQLFGIYNNNYEGKNDSIVIFLCSNFSFDPKSNAEIANYNFFKLTELPKDISPGTKKRIEEYMEKQYPCFGKW